MRLTKEDKQIILSKCKKDEVDMVREECNYFNHSEKKIQQIYNDIKEKWLEIAIINNLTEKSCGDCYNYAIKLAKNTFNKKNNFNYEKDNYNDLEQERFDEYFSENLMLYLQEAYDIHGIDKTIDQNCRREAINIISRREFIHPYIIEYIVSEYYIF